NTLQPVRTVPAFLIGYLLLWTGFLIAAAIGDTILHGIISDNGWLAQRSTILPTAALLMAAAWQLTPVKRAYLRGCRTGRVFPASGHRADLSSLRFGTRHGMACLGSCGPMMLVMLTTNSWHLLWMAALSILIWLEKARGLGRRLARPTAAAFAGLAALTFLLS
ncbi:MAG TPA: DUF2182 domain-containing protein, partial [Pseudonocardiaceae bacterium]|nr:DUF2182 domain-containing protein [Pseudonocardiaceae bacterium]